MTTTLGLAGFAERCTLTTTLSIRSSSEGGTANVASRIAKTATTINGGNMTPDAILAQRATDFITKNVFGDMFASAKRCPKCGVLVDENGECHNGCPEQEFCANLCGNHHDVGDKSTGWNDNGNEPWFCDECAPEQKEAIESTKRNIRANSKQFQGW